MKNNQEINTIQALTAMIQDEESDVFKMILNQAIELIKGEPVEEVCIWDNSDPIRYKTSCGKSSGIEPEYHEDMKYCTYCGKLMKVKE